MLVVTKLSLQKLQLQIVFFCLFLHTTDTFYCVKSACAFFLKHSSLSNSNSNSLSRMSPSFSFRLLFLTFFYYAVEQTTTFFFVYQGLSHTILSLTYLLAVWRTSYSQQHHYILNINYYILLTVIYFLF